ncbi:MAG: CYTH domain-containing protein [Parcubacteria group bacterium]|nr:CYTH domain-containing protein [Parcubacteria group bacterium]
MENEIEAKFLSISKDSTRDNLRTAGFKLETPEYLMRRKTFDFSRVAPGRNKWGRVRQESNKVTMTIKEIRGSGVNDTYEIELTVNDFDTATAFFEACNIPTKASQENMREVWVRNVVEVTIDTWPGLNPFIEIEGEDEKTVREVSRELGFDFEKAVFGSIDLVYEKELGISAESITRLPEIIFSNPPKKKRHVNLV